MTKRPTASSAKGLSAKEIASTAMLIALMIVMMFTPLGRLQLPIVSVTIAHIPILIAVIVFGLYPGLIVAAAFGITSLCIAAVSPTSILDPFFINPLISILPRLLIPITTYFSYRGLCAVFKKWDKGSVAATAISVIIGNLTNTFGVYAMLYIIYARAILEKTGAPAIGLIITAISTTTLIKCVVVVVLTTPIAQMLKKVARRSH